MKIKGEPIIGKGVMTVKLDNNYDTQAETLYDIYDDDVSEGSKYLNLYADSKLTVTFANKEKKIETEALLSDRVFLNRAFDKTYECTPEAYMAERGIEIKQTEKERIRETFTNSTFSDEERDDIEKYFTLKKADDYLKLKDFINEDYFSSIVACEFEYQQPVEFDDSTAYPVIAGVFYPNREDELFDEDSMDIGGIAYDFRGGIAYDSDGYPREWEDYDVADYDVDYNGIENWLWKEYREIVQDGAFKEKYNPMVAIDKETGEESFINLYEKDGKIFDMKAMMKKLNKALGDTISYRSGDECTFYVDKDYIYEVTSYIQNLHRYAVLEQGRGTNKGNGEIER